MSTKACQTDSGCGTNSSETSRNRAIAYQASRIETSVSTVRIGSGRTLVNRDSACPGGGRSIRSETSDDEAPTVLDGMARRPAIVERDTSSGAGAFMGPHAGPAARSQHAAERSGFLRAPGAVTCLHPPEHPGWLSPRHYTPARADSWL